MIIDTTRLAIHVLFVVVLFRPAPTKGCQSINRSIKLLVQSVRMLQIMGLLERLAALTGYLGSCQRNTLKEQLAVN